MKKITYIFIAISIIFVSCKKEEGCTDPAATNYNSDAENDDGSCLFSGCTDSIATNYDPLANSDDGSCLFSGCTDSIATNYDPLASSDDGSCIFDIVGVWTPNSIDYDISVTATLAGQTIYSMDTSYTSTPQDTSWDFEGNMEFTSSGTLITSDDIQSYTVSGDTITITEYDGETSEATYTVSKTNLSITIVDSETETDMTGVTNVMNYEMTINCTRQ